MLDVVLPVFGLILAGYVAGKTPLFLPAALAGLDRFVLYAAVPSLLFRTLAKSGVARAIEPGILLAYFGGCFAAMAVAYVVGRRVLRLKADASGIFAMGGTFGNTVLMGIPLIYTIYGERGLVVMSNITAFHSALLFPLATLLVSAGRADAAVSALKALQATLRSMLLNPIIIAIVLGLLAGLAGFVPPGPLDRILEMLGLAAIPAALFALGAGQAHYRAAGDIGEMAAVSAIKLLLHPLLVWLLAGPMLGLEPATAGTVVLAAAMPVGINVYLMARQHDCHVASAASAMIVTTALSLLTVGVLLGWLPR